jgi:hypothetical protein
MDVEKSKVNRISRRPSAEQIVIYQKQPESRSISAVSVSVITCAAVCTRDIKSRTAMAKAVINKKKGSSQASMSSI